MFTGFTITWNGYGPHILSCECGWWKEITNEIQEREQVLKHVEVVHKLRISDVYM